MSIRRKSSARGAVPLLARDGELRHLRQGLAKALDATRQVVFVTGEPGIGKTALVEAFIGHVALADPAVRIGRGQCLKHRGPGEAYLPILEALDRLCRVPASGDEVIRLLDRHAPTWLAQMPGLLEPAALEALERRNRSATRERMLREMAEAVEAISAERPLLLAIEDLQWSDASTIDLLSWLAQRREPARLMVIGTCRPAEAKPDGRPLHATVRELCRQGRATELALAFLDEAAVAEYLRSWLGDALLPAWLPRLLHERTDGNPLFVVDLVEFVDRPRAPGGDGRGVVAAGHARGARRRPALEPAAAHRAAAQPTRRGGRGDPRGGQRRRAGILLGARGGGGRARRGGDGAPLRQAGARRSPHRLARRRGVVGRDDRVVLRLRPRPLPGGPLRPRAGRSSRSPAPTLRRVPGAELRPARGGAGRRARLALPARSRLRPGLGLPPARGPAGVPAQRPPRGDPPPRPGARHPPPPLGRRGACPGGARLADAAGRNPDRDGGVVEPRRRERLPARAQTVPARA